MSKFQKKVNYFLKKEKIFTKLVNSLVTIFNVFVWLRLYWLRLRCRKPLYYIITKVEPDFKGGDPIVSTNTVADPRFLSRRGSQPPDFRQTTIIWQEFS